MSPQNTPNTEQSLREQLVAYLDGELPPEEARALEARLGSDEDYQQELQSLEKAWDALDQLPQATASKDFSQTTLEMAAVEAKKEVASLTSELPVVKRRQRWAVWAIAGAAVLLGFLLGRMVITTPNRTLARDLPVIWQVDTLIQAPSGPFLTTLAERAPGLVDEFNSPENKAAASVWQAIGDESLSQRSRRIRELPSAEKSRLQSSKSRFQVLSPNLQDALHERHTSLAAEQQDNPRVYEVALAYGEWAASQTPEVRAELRSLESDDARLARIEDIRKRELAMSSRRLSSEDASSLRRVVRELADREEVRRLPAEIKAAREEILEELASRQRGADRRVIGWITERGKHLDRVLDNHPAMPVALLSAVANSDGRDGRWGRMLLGPRAGELRTQARDDWRVVETLLTAALSDKARKGLRQVPEQFRANRLREWVLESAVGAMEPSNLEDFFASDALSDRERNELLALPRDEMYKRLRGYYFDREVGLDPRTLQELGPMLRGFEGRGGRPPGPPPSGDRPPRERAPERDRPSEEGPPR